VAGKTLLLRVLVNVSLNDWGKKFLLKAPGGLILPDKATIYVAAIEDGDYKQEKIECNVSCLFFS